MPETRQEAFMGVNKSGWFEREDICHRPIAGDEQLLLFAVMSFKSNRQQIVSGIVGIVGDAIVSRFA